MLEYLCTGIICSEKRTVIREGSSRKTVSFEEQMMSKDKIILYTSILAYFKVEWSFCVYYPSNIFRNRKFGNITWISSSPVLAGKYKNPFSLNPKILGSYTRVFTV